MSATILVVDDEECVRELLYLQLSNAGYRVLLAEDAIIAGNFLLDERVDLLLADIEMPFMDGLDLVQALRNDPSISSMPVVFVTSHGEYEGRAKELGAVAYLRKPVPADELLATVARHVKGRELILNE
ncbi:MAG TPA: response regulator [Burkholderiales bacterium]|nr:response regulator [Burkholderiales bacterium]